MTVNPRLGGTVSHGGTIPEAEGPQGGGGPPERAIAVLFFLVTVALVGATLFLSEQHFIDDPLAQAQRGDIAGLDEDSLILRGNLRRALDEVQDKAPRTTIKNLRLAPVSLDMTVRDSNGRQEIVRVDPAYRASTTDFGDSTDAGYPFSAINLSAPAKITKAVARRAGASTDDLDYMVLTESPGFGGGRESYGWSVFLKRDVPIARRQWQAAGNGSDVRKLGAPPRAVLRQQARQQRESRQLQKKIQARSRCFSRAKDAAGVQRCVARFD
ncbi:MAG: hypothetical protein H0V29_11895 [Thermoleophilaceae bacterium]|nr:hypothetical protein [Thermoleophilaceae bacterium]